MHAWTFDGPVLAKKVVAFAEKKAKPSSLLGQNKRILDEDDDFSGVVRADATEVTSPADIKVVASVCDDSVVEIETVTSLAQPDWSNSLAVDADGHPHIGFHTRQDGALRYAHIVAGIWKIDVVDDVGTVGVPNSIALDDNGRPTIAYGDLSQRTLKWAHHDGNAWHIETLAQAGDWYLGSGVEPVLSLAMDGDRPHIPGEFAEGA